MTSDPESASTEHARVAVNAQVNRWGSEIARMRCFFPEVSHPAIPVGWLESGLGYFPQESADLGELIHDAINALNARRQLRFPHALHTTFAQNIPATLLKKPPLYAHLLSGSHFDINFEVGLPS